MSAETLQALVARLDRRGDRPALGLRAAYGARWWSYGRLHVEALRFAGTLEALGVARGDRVAIWGPNTPEWVAAALGAIMRGAVVVPIDADASPGHAERLARLASTRVLLHAASLELGASDLQTVTLTAPAGDARGQVLAVGADDPAFQLFTSGSTREPRPVLLTHRNLAVQTAAFERWGLLTRLRSFRLLALSPLSHVQGVVMGMFVPLSLGLSVLYSESVEPADVIRGIRHQRANLLLAVPRVQSMLADALRNLPHRDGDITIAERVAAIRHFPLRRHVLFLATHRELGYSFWVLLVGGATLAAEDERFWYECGYVLVQGYGLTETTAIVTVGINSPFGARLGSVGRPLPHHDLKIADNGEVLVGGPSVAPRAGDDGPAHREGYLRTGDIASLDVRGRLWLQGRKNNLIVTAEGENVHAEDVEAKLRSVAGVRDAVVADLHNRGQVHAVLLLADGGVAENAVAAANASLEPYQRIRSWSVWPAGDFPRTAVLKVRRADVIGAVADAATVAPPDATPTLDAIRAEGDHRRRLRLLARYVCSEAAGDGREPEARIEDFGLSSLDVVELLTLIEAGRSVVLPQLSVTPRTSLTELRVSVSEGRSRGAASPLPTRQPRWSGALPGRLLRLLTRPLLVGTWTHLSARISGDWERGRRRDSCILAVAPHRHWLDAFIVQSCLPAFTETVTVTNRDFAERFSPTPEVRRRTRMSVGLAYHMLWPMVSEFVIVPNYGSTRTGLYELGAAIERGRTPISFPKGLAPPDEPNPRHETGVAVLSVQTSLPVMPVWIAGNDELSVRPSRPRPRITVRFGDPIETDPATDPAEVVDRVEAAFAMLAR